MTTSQTSSTSLHINFSKKNFIKICGITRQKDALLAAEMGVDALGFIIGAESSRTVDFTQAQAIIDELPTNIKKVALVVNQSKDFVKKIITELPINIIQFHGDETPDFCKQFNFPFFKVLRVKNFQHIHQDIQDLLQTGTSAVLLDKWHDKKYGGTGETITSTSLLSPSPLQQLPQPFILAGGLNTDNIIEQINHFQPCGVDINSGIETEPGIKDHPKLRAIVKLVRKHTEIT